MNNSADDATSRTPALPCEPKDPKATLEALTEPPAPPQAPGLRAIRQVGDTVIQPRHRLSCHCGAVVLELALPEGIVNPRRCDCSICRRKGAVVASVSLDGITVVRGEEHLRLYQFNTRVARHYFCGVCGIYTHHQRRSFPDQYGYNVGCLEGVDPFLIPDVPVNDGVNHPADRAASPAAQA